MGNWSIHIEGIGPHHNGTTFDADSKFILTVENLKRSGQIVTHASFTYGAASNVEDATAVHFNLAAERYAEFAAEWDRKNREALINIDPSEDEQC